MKKTSMVIRLLGICAFLLVQALQFDHNVDQSQGNPHTNCVVCQNAADPFSSDHAALILVNIVYNEQSELKREHLIPASIPDRTLLLRGPPTYS